MIIPNDLKKILSIIQKKGPLTKNVLLELTNMKLTSLNRLLRPLFDMQLIEIFDYANETGGRPSALIDVNNHHWALIGIDISRTYINIVLTTLKMQLIDQVSIPLDHSKSPHEMIDIINKKIISYKMKYTSKTILGVGIGMIGPIDKDTGILLNLEPFPVDTFFNIDIKNPIELATQLPVKIESGANLAVLSEYYFGEAKNYENIAYINCGVGIRSSVLLSNKLLNTKNSSESAFAHMIVDYDGPLCSCGQKGCIDASSSIFSMLNMYKANVMNNSPRLMIEKTIEDIQYMDFLAAAHKGDPLCISILNHGATILGIGISNYINTLNLEYIILSGPLVKNSTYFYNKVLSTTLAHVQSSFSGGVLFNKGGSFKHNSIAIGGATYFFETLLDENN